MSFKTFEEIVRFAMDKEKEASIFIRVWREKLFFQAPKKPWRALPGRNRSTSIC